MAQCDCADCAVAALNAPMQEEESAEDPKQKKKKPNNSLRRALGTFAHCLLASALMRQWN
jgi:hypothetical protein